MWLTSRPYKLAPNDLNIALQMAEVVCEMLWTISLT
jgi:hypothetical protein